MKIQALVMTRPNRSITQPPMRFKVHCHAFSLIFCLVGGFLCAATASAAPYELRIYSDDNPNKEESEIELIMSAAKPKQSAEGPNGRVVQTLVEYGYGLGNGWAIGLELPTSHVQGHNKVEGLKAEVQYVADHNKANGWYWGVRGDVGYTSTPYETRGGNSVDINPIIGYRWNTWHFVANPSIEIPLSSAGAQPQFQPSAKISNAVSDTGRLGVEYFSSWGAVSSIRPQRQRDETLYLVWDEKLATSRVNIGLGKPLNPNGGSVDQWVFKAGFNFELD